MAKFNLHLPGQTPESGIALATRLNTTIPNQTTVEVSQFMRNAYARARVGKDQRWEERRPDCTGYNCAGHVWASRRTSVYDEESYRLILREDGYNVTDESDLKVGDLVLYLEAERIVHVAQICFIESPQHPHQVGTVVWALSKWNDFSGEYRHRVLDHFYENSVSIEYRTDRPVN